MRSYRSPLTSATGIEFDLLADELSELLGGLHGLQAAVEADRRLAITVSKQLPHGLVLTRMVLEINRRRGVSKLMDRDPKSDRFLNARGDLLAELESVLWLTAFAREQPGGIRSAKPRRPELLNVFIDEVRQGLIELEAEIDTVLHIIVRENQPIGRVQPAGLDKVLPQLDADEIGKSNGREAEDRDRHSELRRAALIGA